MTLSAVPSVPSPSSLSGATQQRPPLHATYARADLRVGDAERTAVCEALSIHFAEGRLTPDELDARLEAATGAVTLSDLRRLTADLPRLAPPSPPGPPRSSDVPPPPPGPSPLDVLIGIGVIGAMGLILVMLVGIGLAGPGLFLASVVGGMLALGVGAGGTHLLYRVLRTRR